MSFEDQILDRMVRLRFTVEEFDVESIFNEVDRYLPEDMDVEDMDKRTFIQIVERNVW